MSHSHTATLVNVVDKNQISNKINGIGGEGLTISSEQCGFSGIFLPFMGVVRGDIGILVRISTHDGTQQY